MPDVTIVAPADISNFMHGLRREAVLLVQGNSFPPDRAFL